MLKIIDDRRQALIFDQARLIPFLVDHFYSTLQSNIEKKGRFNVALAGGSTPRLLYKAITDDQRKDNFDWKKVFIYFGDERAVNLDDKESNFHMSMEAGFKNIPEVNIFPMPAFKKVGSAALEYEKILPEYLDLIFLGMGDDGHTASLFPRDPMCRLHDQKVAIGFIESKNAYRMTLTVPYINHSKEILILVTGDSKKDKIKEVLSSEGAANPIYQVGTKLHKALYILDEAAGKLL